ncbi:MAG: tRNA (guanosine(46)-N7)-methyltransferase TrmB [Bacteroidales bacterium]|nr:tRNA (guanosine(46)-N7)-methyltransferase TrmB [Bacteroidales bacterium]
MGHGKLKKFAENETFRCLLQPDAASVLAKPEGSKELILRDHAIKGRWNSDMFEKPQPIVVELGCGKGDYTIALARRHPEMNFIGVDIKGARLWKGAKEATEDALGNVAFLRTRIEFIDAFFGPSEVSEIWLTFSDPQLRGSENARLTSPLFLQRYSRFLRPGGIVHLKTDSRFLYEYTQSVIRANDLEVLAFGTDIYHDGILSGRIPENRLHFAPTPPIASDGPLPLMCPRVGTGFQGCAPAEYNAWDINAVFEVQTFYETMFLKMGLPITYLAFRLDREGKEAGEPFAYPTDFDAAYWREAEGPRRSFSHQPAKRPSNGSD